VSKWFIFKCQNCGKKFKEKFTKQQEKEIDITRIARRTFMGQEIVSNHKCKENIYGCAKLIGAEDRHRAKTGGGYK
jgi:transposase-like protein